MKKWDLWQYLEKENLRWIGYNINKRRIEYRNRNYRSIFRRNRPFWKQIYKIKHSNNSITKDRNKWNH